MSDIERFTLHDSGLMLRDKNGAWVRYQDHLAEVERLIAERDAARAEFERLTAERDMARAEVRRLIAERDQPESRPKGRERGRFGLDGHYLDAMEPARRTDEEIWRDAFMVQLMKSASYQWERTSEEADLVLATYRKRWPR